MDIYKLNNKRLNSIENVGFESEKEIQSIVENNSEELFDLTFVKSEVVCNKSLDLILYVGMKKIIPL